MKRLILPCAALLAMTACRAPEEAEPPLVVEVATVPAARADLQSTVRAPAFLFGREQANLNARIAAPVRRLHARKGDIVEAGQLLAELDNRDLAAQKAEAAAAVADAEANLGKISAGTLPGDVERARGQVAVAEAALRQASQIYERRKQLFEQGAIPQRDLLVSETEFRQAQANAEVARKSLELLLNQSRERDIAMARARLEQARARLAFIEAQLDFTRIRSPFAGAITEQFLFPGDMARPDQPIFTVTEISVAVARAQVPEAEAAQVRPRLACRFEPSDMPGRSFAGRISVINEAVDPARRTVETWCEIPNPGRTLKPGEFGHAVIVVADAPGSIVVPAAAVQFEEGSNRGVVFIARSGAAVRRAVRTGIVSGDKVQILEGVREGEPVILEGAYGLEDGTRIRVREAQGK